MTDISSKPTEYHVDLQNRPAGFFANLLYNGL
jgi:hypothetical protein